MYLFFPPKLSRYKDKLLDTPFSLYRNCTMRITIIFWIFCYPFSFIPRMIIFNSGNTDLEPYSLAAKSIEYLWYYHLSLSKCF